MVDGAEAAAIARLDLAELLQRLKAPPLVTREPVPAERVAVVDTLLEKYKAHSITDDEVLDKIKANFDNETIRSRMLVMTQRCAIKTLPAWTVAFEKLGCANVVPVA